MGDDENTFVKTGGKGAWDGSMTTAGRERGMKAMANRRSAAHANPVVADVIEPRAPTPRVAYDNKPSNGAVTARNPRQRGARHPPKPPALTSDQRRDIAQSKQAATASSKFDSVYDWGKELALRQEQDAAKAAASLASEEAARLAEQKLKMYPPIADDFISAGTLKTLLSSPGFQTKGSLTQRQQKNKKQHAAAGSSTAGGTGNATSVPVPPLRKHVVAKQSNVWDFDNKQREGVRHLLDHTGQRHQAAPPVTASVDADGHPVLHAAQTAAALAAGQNGGENGVEINPLGTHAVRTVHSRSVHVDSAAVTETDPEAVTVRKYTDQGIPSFTFVPSHGPVRAIVRDGQPAMNAQWTNCERPLDYGTTAEAGMTSVKTSAPTQGAIESGSAEELVYHTQPNVAIGLPQLAPLPTITAKNAATAALSERLDALADHVNASIKNEESRGLDGILDIVRAEEKAFDDVFGEIIMQVTVEYKARGRLLNGVRRLYGSLLSRLPTQATVLQNSVNGLEERVAMLTQDLAASDLREAELKSLLSATNKDLGAVRTDLEAAHAEISFQETEVAAGITRLNEYHEMSTLHRKRAETRLLKSEAYSRRLEMQLRDVREENADQAHRITVLEADVENLRSNWDTEIKPDDTNYPGEMTEEEEERDNERAEHKSRRITSGPGHDGNVMGDDYEWQEEELELLASAASHGYEMTPSQLRAITLSRSSKPPSAAGTQGKKFHGSGGGSAGGAGILHFAEDGVPVGSFPAGSGGAGGASAAGGSNGDDFRPGLEHALADVLPYLEDAETGLAAAGKSELIALATLPGPPPAVASVMGALMVILRRKEDWATAKASLLSGTDLLDAIFDFDKDDLSITQLHKLRTYATLPDFSPEVLADCAGPVGQALCQWCIGVMMFGTMWLQHFPTTIQGFVGHDFSPPGTAHQSRVPTKKKHARGRTTSELYNRSLLRAHALRVDVDEGRDREELLQRDFKRIALNVERLEEKVGACLDGAGGEESLVKMSARRAMAAGGGGGGEQIAQEDRAGGDGYGVEGGGGGIVGEAHYGPGHGGGVGNNEMPLGDGDSRPITAAPVNLLEERIQVLDSRVSAILSRAGRMAGVGGLTESGPGSLGGTLRDSRFLGLVVGAVPGGKVETVSLRPPKNLEWLLSFIRTVYEEKRVSDELETRQAAKMYADATLTPLPEHLLKVATIKYGLKEKVAASLLDIAVTVSEWESSVSEVALFSQFLSEKISVADLSFYCGVRYKVNTVKVGIRLPSKTCSGGQEAICLVRAADAVRRALPMSVATGVMRKVEEAAEYDDGFGQNMQAGTGSERSPIPENFYRVDMSLVLESILVGHMVDERQKGVEVQLRQLFSTVDDKGRQTITEVQFLRAINRYAEDQGLPHDKTLKRQGSLSFRRRMTSNGSCMTVDVFCEAIASIFHLSQKEDVR